MLHLNSFLRKSKREQLELREKLRKQEGQHFNQFRSERLRHKIQAVVAEEDQIRRRNNEILESIKKSDELISKQTSRALTEHALNRMKVRLKFMNVANGFKGKYYEYIKTCYPVWARERQIKNVMRVKRFDQEINEIEKRRKEAGKDFETDMKLLDALSRKV